jgi:hypothetical protein
MGPRMIETGSYSDRPRSAGPVQCDFVIFTDREENLSPELETPSMAVGASLRVSGGNSIQYKIDSCCQPGLIWIDLFAA